MKKLFYEKQLFIFYLVSLALLNSACHLVDNNTIDRDFSPESILPTEYAELQNPIEDPQEFEILQGEELFQYNCAACHGNTALGNGSIGESLEPPPSNLNIVVPKVKNNYIYWRIAKGGIQEPFNSAMPSWDAVLTDQEIWKIVSFLHTLGE